MDPMLELQGAIISKLRSTTAVTSICGQRSYDKPPDPAQYPFVSLGPTQDLSIDADCIDASEITVQIDVWSDAFGTPEARRLARAVRNALHNVDLTLTTNGFVSLTHNSTRVIRDPQPEITHAVLTFTALIDAA